MVTAPGGRDLGGAEGGEGDDFRRREMSSLPVGGAGAIGTCSIGAVRRSSNIHKRNDTDTSDDMQTTKMLKGKQ